MTSHRDTIPGRHAKAKKIERVNGAIPSQLVDVHRPNSVSSAHSMDLRESGELRKYDLDLEEICNTHKLNRNQLEASAKYRSFQQIHLFTSTRGVLS